jgi:hypothetical protein
MWAACHVLSARPARGTLLSNPSRVVAAPRLARSRGRRKNGQTGDEQSSKRGRPVANRTPRPGPVRETCLEEARQVTGQATIWGSFSPSFFTIGHAPVDVFEMTVYRRSEGRS